MKLYNVDVEKFAEMIQGCKGKVVLITEDGDRLVTNSMLSALVGFAPFLKVAEAKKSILSVSILKTKSVSSTL